MAMRNLLFLTVVSALFFSCEKVIDLDVPEGDPQLVVDAWYTDEDTSQFVKLSSTAPYFEEEETPRISGALVVLHTYNGNELESTFALEEEPSKPGFYAFPGPAEIGKGYQLEIDAETFPAVKSDIQLVREPPPILDIYWEETTPSFEDSLAIYRIYLSTFEFEGSGDYYRWFIFVDGVYQNDPFNINVESDQLVDGAVLPQFSISTDRYRFGETVRVIQSRINENAYDYLSLLRFQTAFIGSPFDTPPAPLTGNLDYIEGEGQALGFFGASATSIAEVQVGVE